MKSWQQRWLWFLAIASIYHFIRDVLQSLGVETVISTIVVKQNGLHSGIWNPINTYLIEICLLSSSLYLLWRRQFGRLGYLSICIVVVTMIFFFIYWFVL